MAVLDLSDSKSPHRAVTRVPEKSDKKIKEVEPLEERYDLLGKGSGYGERE